MGRDEWRRYMYVSRYADYTGRTQQRPLDNKCSKYSTGYFHPLSIYLCSMYNTYIYIYIYFFINIEIYIAQVSSLKLYI
jgi:hypothetical protein